MHNETCRTSRLEIRAKNLMILSSSLVKVDDNREILTHQKFRKCFLKQAGTGPSRRHIQGSKIAKRLQSVKYSFTVLEIRNFLKKFFFSKKLHTQKNGPSGALTSHNAEKLKGGTL